MKGYGETEKITPVLSLSLSLSFCSSVCLSVRLSLSLFNSFFQSLLLSVCLYLKTQREERRMKLSKGSDDQIIHEMKWRLIAAYYNPLQEIPPDERRGESGEVVVNPRQDLYEQ